MTLAVPLPSPCYLTWCMGGLTFFFYSPLFPFRYTLVEYVQQHGVQFVVIRIFRAQCGTSSQLLCQNGAFPHGSSYPSPVLFPIKLHSRRSAGMVSRGPVSKCSACFPKFVVGLGGSRAGSAVSVRLLLITRHPLFNCVVEYGVLRMGGLG